MIEKFNTEGQPENAGPEQESLEDYMKRMKAQAELADAAEDSGDEKVEENVEPKPVDKEGIILEEQKSTEGDVEESVGLEEAQKLGEEELEQVGLKTERIPLVGEIIELTRELSMFPEVFPFPGMDQESYEKIKAEDEEYPGMTTPIDEIMERLRNEGMKVTFGKNPESGNVYILPNGSDNIEMDSIRPRQLNIEGIENAKLRLLAEKELKKKNMIRD
jgi:hypothetical protein